MGAFASQGAALVTGLALVSAVYPMTAISAEASDSTLTEIVVTAQRREESLQKTSLALQVVSAAELADAGVIQVRDLGAVVPGLIISQGGAYGYEVGISYIELVKKGTPKADITCPAITSAIKARLRPWVIAHD